jgi:two-component system sensor histidine kinase ResE
MRSRQTPSASEGDNVENSGADNNYLTELNQEAEQVFSGETVTFRGESPFLNQSIIGVGVPIGEDQGLFLLSPLSGLQEMAYSIRDLTLQITLAAVVLALLLAYFLARGIVNPVQKMQATAHQMAQGNLAARLTGLPEDELGSLGKTLNYLATELETKLEELSTEKGRMQSMLTGMSEGALGVDKAREVLLANPKLVEIFSLTEEPVGKSLSHCFPSEVVNLVTDIINNKKQQQVEFEYHDQIIVLQGAPIYRQEDKFWGVIVLARDVTKLRELEEMRRLFVANVSHELKTPLTSVQGYIEAVLDDMVEDPEQKKEYLQRVLNETDRMSKLVEDILDLSQLQSGQINLKREEVDLVEIINSVLVNLEQKLENRKVVCSLPDSCKVLGDRDRLREVLINLISNAVKFTEAEGKIELKVEPKEKMVITSVIDDGIGIPVSEQDYIWERFHQVDRSRSPNQEGTGLGLAIVKEIIENLGGEVSLNSEEGLGSEFKFSLPRLKTN